MNTAADLDRAIAGVIGARVPFAEVRERLLRACRTLRALPDAERKFQTMHNGWPEFASDPEMAYGYNEIPMPRFRPTPADVSDYLTALAWARGLDRKEFRLIWLMSYGLSYRLIGIRLGRERGRPYSDERARQLCRDVMLKCWSNANA